MEPGKSSPLVKVLLLATSAFLCAALVCAYGWYSTRNRPLKIESLSPNEVQHLVQQYFTKAPGVLLRTWFCPDIGSIFAPNTKISLWNDTFTSNEIGMRTHSVEKPADVFRVVFDGDSWAYGMGVTLDKSFPAQFEALANKYSGSAKKIQAWTLALPGWNTENEMSALEAFWDRIRPDAVVLCPTENDIDGSQDVGPSGEWCRPFWPTDYDLGVKSDAWDSPLTRRLWRDVFRRIRRTELLLEQHHVPMSLFFVGNWLGGEPFAHYHLSQAGIKAPYLVAPPEFYVPPYVGAPQDFGHGTPQAYDAFARMIYRLVEKQLGWKPLPDAMLAKRTSGEPVPVFTKTPEGNWREVHEKGMQAWIAKGVPKFSEQFVAGSETSPRQCWGTMDWKSGLVRRSTAILLHRQPSASKLLIQVARVPELKSLYPLDVKITIPSFSQDVTVSRTIAADGPDAQTIDAPIPKDIPAGNVMEVLFLLPRASVGNDLMPQSLKITRIEQKP
jgi:hypothetical protein